MRRNKELMTIAHILQVFAAVMIVAVLYFARDVLIPLALGVLFAFMLSPVVNRLQRYGLSNVMAVVLTATSVFIALSILMMVIGSGLRDLTTELPSYKEELVRKLSVVESLGNSITSRFSSITEDLSKRKNGASPSGELTSNVPDATADLVDATEGDPEASSANSIHDGTTPDKPLYMTTVTDQRFELRSWAGSIGAVLGPLGTLGLVIVFALFMLIYRDDMRDRLVSVFARGNYVVTMEAIEETSQRISRYLLAQFLMNVSFGIIFSLVIWGIQSALSSENGFPNVVLLGAIAGLARFIPYIGPLFAAFITLALSLAAFPGYSMFIVVALAITVMELTLNNIVEPWLYGTSTGVSPIAVILAAVFWGTLWGPVGLLLATPITVCMVVMGRHVPRFRYLATLLGEEVYIKPSARIYQRLLSSDRHKLVEVIQTEFKGKPVGKAIDTLIVATVKRILNDKEPYGLDDAQLLARLAEGISTSGIFKDGESSKEVISATVSVTTTSTSERSNSNDTDEPTQLASTDEATQPSRLRLECIGTTIGNPAEAFLLNVLAQATESKLAFQILEPEDFPDEEAARMARAMPAMIVVAWLPSRGLRQVKMWCRALRRANYKGKLLVASFGRPHDFDRVQFRIRSAGADAISTSVEQALRILNVWHERLLRGKLDDTSELTAVESVGSSREPSQDTAPAPTRSPSLLGETANENSPAADTSFIA